MALIPEGFNLEVEQQPQDIQTSFTYKLDPYTKRIIGKVDGIEALQQAIFKMMNTERYAYLIYDQNYGVELYDIISGSYSNEFIISEFQRVAKEALYEDERILNVRDFKFSFNNDSVNVEFVIDSVFGEFNIEHQEERR